MFASHPAPEERQEALTKLAEEAPGGVTYEERWREKVKPFTREWLADEVRRGQAEESIALFTRMIAYAPTRADLLCARGDVYRMRAKPEDWKAAQSDYEAAISVGSEPAEVHRGLAAIFRQRKQLPEAKASFQRYLELTPNAPDAAMIKSYIEEFGI
jgi:tetratricopeptide (TPR) repeat protein